METSMIQCMGFIAALAVVGASLPALAGEAGWSGLRPVASSSGKIRLVYRNANECAPSLAVAVWGPGAPSFAPLGYRRVDNGNGG
jgi:hypothetical protein